MEGVSKGAQEYMVSKKDVVMVMKKFDPRPSACTIGYTIRTGRKEFVTRGRSVK